MSLEKWIKETLDAAISPEYLQIENESRFHSSMSGDETHFKIVCASQTFQGMSLFERHRKVNGLLKDAFTKGLHALSLHLYTSEEMEAKKIPKSPQCVNSK